jgi:hypothetical protein
MRVVQVTGSKGPFELVKREIRLSPRDPELYV